TDVLEHVGDSRRAHGAASRAFRAAGARRGWRSRAARRDRGDVRAGRVAPPSVMVAVPRATTAPESPGQGCEARGTWRRRRDLAIRSLFPLLSWARASPAFAATDFELFEKKVARFGTQRGGYPKALCVCRDASLERAVGFLLRGSSPPIGSTPFVTSQ